MSAAKKISFDAGDEAPDREKKATPVAQSGRYDRKTMQ